MHQVPITIGWITMKVIETAPSGTIMSPNSTTSQGMVRQRARRADQAGEDLEQVGHRADAASGTGQASDTLEVMISSVPFSGSGLPAKNGSQTLSTWPSW